MAKMKNPDMDMRQHFYQEQLDMFLAALLCKKNYSLDNSCLGIYLNCKFSNRFYKSGHWPGLFIRFKK